VKPAFAKAMVQIVQHAAIMSEFRPDLCDRLSGFSQQNHKMRAIPTGWYACCSHHFCLLGKKLILWMLKNINKKPLACFRQQKKPPMSMKYDETLPHMNVGRSHQPNPGGSQGDSIPE